MADLDHNGIDDALEVRAYKEEAARGKFRQQISYGIGAAMVFGLFSGLAVKLVSVAATVGGAAPIFGLVAMGVAGIGLLYLSAKFLSENTVLDQALQAKLITASQAQGKGQTVAIEPTVEKPDQFPAAQGLANTDVAGEAVMNGASDIPKTTTLERQLSEPMITRVAANENQQDKANWQEKVTHGPVAEQARA